MCTPWTTRPGGPEHRALPETLKDALDALERDKLMMDVLGEHVARHYIQGKRKEWNEYQTRVSSWELEKYLVTY